MTQRLEKKSKTSQTPGAELRYRLLKEGFNSKTFGKEFVAAIKSINLIWNSEYLNNFINTYCKKNNLKFRDIGVPLRIALTGSTSSPSIVHIMEILGEEKTLDRLNLSIDLIKN